MNPPVAVVGPPVAGPAALVPGVDLHIIACLRQPPDKTGETRGRCYGVRWAARPDWGFPPGGFRVWRRPVQGQLRTPVGTFFLPATTGWASFRRDAEARRPVCGGPYFPTIEEENLGFLLPLVRLADPRTPVAEHDELTAKAAAFFGDPHTADAGLAWALWRYDPPPPLPLLLANPVTAGPVVAYYRERTVEYLLTLALRFEYAALLGLGTDDPAPGDDPLVYGVEAAWPWAAGEAESAPAPTNQVCAPPPPAWARAERVPGTVAHPVSVAWPTGWAPPAELAPLDAEGKPLPAAALVPRAPCAHTALSWAPPPPEPKLIGHGPVLYLVSRFAHGAATASRKGTPALGPGAVFAPLVVGEYVVRPATEPHFLDLPGMAWPPLEGHYTYEVRGVDLLGALSAPARASLRHHDDLAPPAPRASAGVGPALALAAGGLVSVPLSLRWDAAEDFAGPDAADFRVAARWVPQVTVPVALTAVADVDLLHADVTVASLAGGADAYAGGRLSVPGADYPIVSHTAGAGAVLRVRKLSGGRMPAAGSDGTVQAMGPATPTTRVARLPRRPAAAAMVAAVGATDPLEVTLSPSGTATLPAGEPARVYLHLLRASFDAEPLGGLRWRLAAPEAGSAARELWDAWLALPDPAGVLAGSPALVFPEHALGVTLRAPTGFGAGLLVLAVTAADGAEYVSSPAMAAADPSLAALHGNEGAAAEVVLSLRSEVAPARAAVPAWVPETRLWATSAAAYAEEATYDLAWTAAPDAARYEVWRALEGAVAGATPATSDADLRALAAAQPGAFELRSDQVYAARHTDRLPGRAPTRALYQVRAVTAAGVVGPPSEVIGPVHVPDVRRPPAPNLARAAAAPPAEADRAIAVEWTQGGPVDGVRFEVQRRLETEDDAAFAPAATVAAGTPPGADGRYRIVDPGRVPGLRYAYRVVAVREAPDPADPTGAARRDIASAPSAARVAVAISSVPLAAPGDFAAAWDGAAGEVALAWTNPEAYTSLQLWRRSAEGHGYLLVGTAAGDATALRDATAAPGTWRYQLRARGVSREARTSDAEVTVP